MTVSSDARCAQYAHSGSGGASAGLPPLTDVDLRNAGRMKQACVRAANLKGAEIVYCPASEMPDGAVGWFTADATPAARRILISDALDPVSEAVTLAHEVGHLYDPGLNHGDMERVYLTDTGRCEAVAHRAAQMTAEAWHVDRCVPAGWFEQQIEQHWPLSEVLSDDRLTHRADRSAMTMMPESAAARLRGQRAAEGRPRSGMSLWARLRQSVSALFSADDSGPAAGGPLCGKMMPRAGKRCVLPAGHHGPCRSRL